MQAFATRPSHLAASTQRTKYDQPPHPPSPSAAPDPGLTTAVLFQRPTPGSGDSSRASPSATRARQLSWLKSRPLSANDQASVLRATHVPRRFIERLSVVSGVCCAWAIAAGARSASATPSFEGDGYVSGGGGMFVMVFALIDAATTRSEEDKALGQYQKQQDMLLEQHLLMNRLKTVLRRHPDDFLAQAACEVVLFNIATLNRLLDAHEKAHEPSQRLDGLRQLRHFRADLWVLAHQTQRLRRRLNRCGHDPQLQARYLRRKEEFEALRKNVAQLEAELRQSPLDWVQRLWDEGFDGLTLPSVILARDHALPVGTAVPALSAMACTLAAEALVQAGQEILPQILDTASAAIGTCLQPVNLVNGVLDLVGGRGLHAKASASKHSARELLAHLQRVYDFYLNEPDAFQRAVCLETVFQRMKVLQEALEHAHRAARLGQARRLRGVAILLLAVLNTVSGSQSAAHKGSLALSAPGNVIAGTSAVLFLGLLSSSIFANWVKETRARHRERKALKEVENHGLNRFSQQLHSRPVGSGELRHDHPRLNSSHLLKEWLSAQLMLLHKDIAQPLSGVEELLLNMALPRHRDLVVEALRHLRCVSLLTSAADFRMIVRATVNDLMGERGFAPESLVNQSLPNMALPDEELMPVCEVPGRADAPGLSGSSFHLLDQACKQAGRERLKGARDQVPLWLRWLRGLGPNRLATPPRTLDRLQRADGLDQRHVPPNHQHADRLSRHILQRLLAQLPREEDGHTIAWPDGMAGDTGDCLDALLAQMVKDCNRAAAALQGAAKRHRDTRELARRLEAQARVASQLRQHVQREQGRELPWWGWLPPAAVA